MAAVRCHGAESCGGAQCSGGTLRAPWRAAARRAALMLAAPVAFMADAQLCCPFTARAPQRRHLAAQELAVPVPHRRHELLARAGDRCVWRRAPAAAGGRASQENAPPLRVQRRPLPSPNCSPPAPAAAVGLTPRHSPPPGSGRIAFAHPTTQQQLLVWRDRPRTAMVIKKLGSELNPQFYEVGVDHSIDSRDRQQQKLRQRRQRRRPAAAAATPCSGSRKHHLRCSSRRRRERHTPGPLAASPKAARAHTRTHQHTNTPTFHTPPCRLCATWARPRACR